MKLRTTMAKKRQSTALTNAARAGAADTAFKSIAEILRTARGTAYSAVNQPIVLAYWQIGCVIVQEEQKGRKRAGYGETLIEELALRLTENFGRGFDRSNLWHMHKFYLAFPDILDAARRELSWTHYRLILRIENELARSFYLNEPVNSRWSTRELERQINSCMSRRMMLPFSIRLLARRIRLLSSLTKRMKTAPAG